MRKPNSGARHPHSQEGGTQHHDRESATFTHDATRRDAGEGDGSDGDCTSGSCWIDARIEYRRVAPTRRQQVLQQVECHVAHA